MSKLTFYKLKIWKWKTNRFSSIGITNLTSSFSVPETVRQAEAAITEGKLLEAHKVKSRTEPNLKKPNQTILF